MKKSNISLWVNNMKHIATFQIQKREVERVNRLLAIPSLSEMNYVELLENGANTDQCEGIIHVVFDDGSSLNYDLCSGQENYYDDVVWTSPDGNRDVCLECTFELGDIEFSIDDDVYIVELEVV